MWKALPGSSHFANHIHLVQNLLCAMGFVLKELTFQVS